MLTPEQLVVLEERYTPADQQKCRVCGAPLVFSSSSERGGSRYNCSSDDATRRSIKSLRERLEHYEQSACPRSVQALCSWSSWWRRTVS
jgi:transcription initiation factor IIE alpha subunit